MRVSGLWIYPIKSCRGIAVDSFGLDDRGPVLDRRWMLTDPAGSFMTQREHPRMALIDVAVDGSDVCVSAPGMSLLRFAQDAAADGTADCVVWDDTVRLQHVDHDIDQWFSDFMGRPCSLMRMPQSTKRIVDRTYAPAPRLVSLADAFPMLLIGEASLELLNGKLAAKGELEIPMKRFRPNVVIAETTPHAEDAWQTIRIGNVACDVVKPCARCAITTVDTRTGMPGKEPLRTLAEYRKAGSKVLFGQNVIHRETGTLRVGDAIAELPAAG